MLGGGARARIIDRDPANIECRVSGPGVALELVAQASPRAWTSYDTTTVHLVQAFGSGSVHKPGRLPQGIHIRGAIASWVPAQQELVATNGTQFKGGSFLTVTLTREPKGWGSALRLAEEVATATLAVAPRGPDPGPPPS